MLRTALRRVLLRLLDWVGEESKGAGDSAPEVRPDSCRVSSGVDDFGANRDKFCDWYKVPDGQGGWVLLPPDINTISDTYDRTGKRYEMKWIERGSDGEERLAEYVGRHP